MSGKFRVFLCFMFSAALLACGGGGGSPGSSGTGNASLEVIVSGLPSGTAADVTVTGPSGFSRKIAETQTLTSLVDGTYEVSSGNVTSGSTIFVPDQASRSVTLASSGTQSVAISYAPGGTLTLGLSPVVSGLSSPVHLTAPAGDARLFIVERTGRILIFQNDALLAAPFLDLSDRISTDGERGLLSMAFHPQYTTNGFFYIFYTNLDGDIVVERYTVSSADPNTANPISGRVIITIPHPNFNNHNGGLVSFGPDGMLFISTGDGGGGGDPSGNAQNLNSLLGKLLRIDVTNSADQAYAIPSDNPFRGQTGARSEIWAYGLRNPWRYAFDTMANLLYLTDVGQSTREEINVAGANQGGLNYGWNILEGSLCFAGGTCNLQGLTLPVLEYTAGEGGSCAIIGGNVYSGSAIPELQGRFFYSDLCAGFLKSFIYRNGQAMEQTDWSVPSLSSINSFGQDANGELYMLLGRGDVLRLVRQP